MIRLEKVKKKRKDFTLDISLTVDDGHISALIGPNGAGKTTTFKAILGIVDIDEGKITIDGKEITMMDQADKTFIGAVISGTSFSQYLTINDIAIVLKSAYPGFDADYFDQAIIRSSLPVKKKLREFSTGMMAKFKVICALSHHPKTLILDEPTAGLDTFAREDIAEMLRTHMDRFEDTSMIISSHITSDLATLADDIYLINDGKIILHEDVDVILSDYGLIKINHSAYSDIDKTHIIRKRQVKDHLELLTDEKAYYRENYPEIIIEDCDIDKVMTNFVKGESYEGSDR